MKSTPSTSTNSNLNAITCEARNPKVAASRDLLPTASQFIAAEQGQGGTNALVLMALRRTHAMSWRWIHFERSEGRLLSTTVFRWVGERSIEPHAISGIVPTRLRHV